MFKDIKDRKQNLQMLRDGIKTEFWKVLKKEFERISELETKRALELYSIHKNDDALRSTALVNAIDYIMGSTEDFVRSYDSGIDNLLIDICDKCGNLFETNQGEKEHASLRISNSRFSGK